jgi:glycolate oxidase
VAAAIIGIADPCVAGDAALEICAAVPSAAVQLFGHLSLAGPTSFLPSDGTVLVVACAPEDRGPVEEIGMAFGAQQITVCPPGPEALLLLSHAAPARAALGVAGASLRDPLAVPATRLAEFCAGVRALEHRSGQSVVLVADVSAGAVQPFVLGGGRGADSTGEVLAEVVDLAGELIRDATGSDDLFVATGWTARALDGRGCETSRRMKLALDPQGLLNPGLAF